MIVNVMQSARRSLVERDAVSGTKILLVKVVAGSSGPTIANEMQRTTRLMTEFDTTINQRVLLVKQVL